MLKTKDCLIRIKHCSSFMNTIKNAGENRSKKTYTVKQAKEVTVRLHLV